MCETSLNLGRLQRFARSKLFFLPFHLSVQSTEERLSERINQPHSRGRVNYILHSFRVRARAKKIYWARISSPASGILHIPFIFHLSFLRCFLSLIGKIRNIFRDSGNGGGNLIKVRYNARTEKRAMTDFRILILIDSSELLDHNDGSIWSPTTILFTDACFILEFSTLLSRKVNDWPDLVRDSKIG